MCRVTLWMLFRALKGIPLVIRKEKSKPRCPRIGLHHLFAVSLVTLMKILTPKRRNYVGNGMRNVLKCVKKLLPKRRTNAIVHNGKLQEPLINRMMISLHCHNREYSVLLNTHLARLFQGCHLRDRKLARLFQACHLRGRIKHQGLVSVEIHLAL